METWTAKCEETDIALDFHTDLDQYKNDVVDVTSTLLSRDVVK